MVGPDGDGWIWFTTKDKEYLSLFSAQSTMAVAISGTLVDGSSFDAECMISNIDMRGNKGTVRHDAEGWKVSLSNAAEFGILLTVTKGLRLVRGDKVGDNCQIEYVLLNAIFDGTEHTRYDEGRSSRLDTFKFNTDSRHWTIRTDRQFAKGDKSALEAGTVTFLPTAIASTHPVGGESLTEIDEEVDVVCLLMSLATGAATRWTARRVFDDSSVKWLYAGYRPTTGVRNRSFFELVSNHRPSGGLQALLSQCVDSYASIRGTLGLDRAIGFLEESRVQKVVDLRLLLAMLAVETLTYYWCLDDGLAQNQVTAMNIETKINRMAKRFRGIKRKVLQTDLLRSDVRNPLLHTGEIPAMKLDEMLRWADRLYILAFRMILTLVGYTGLFADPTQSRAEVAASLA